MRNRKGATLIETVISMAAGSTLMLLAISLVHQTLSFSKETRELSEGSRSLARVALQFQNDIHLASQAILVKEGIDIQQGPNIIIQYRFLDHRIVREAKNQRHILEYEVYRLGDETQATFSTDVQGETATLLVETATGLIDPAWRLDAQVRPVVGKWIEGETMAAGDPE